MSHSMYIVVVVEDLKLFEIVQTLFSPEFWSNSVKIAIKEGHFQVGSSWKMKFSFLSGGQPTLTTYFPG